MLNKKYALIPLSCALLLGLCSCSGNSLSHVPGQQFQTLTDTMFQKEIVSSTLNLRYTLEHPQNYGIDHYPITYGNTQNISLVAAASPTLDDYRRALFAIPCEQLSFDDRLTYDILSLYLENEKAGEAFLLYQEPLSATIGVQAQLPVLLAEYPFDTKEDVTTYLALIAQTDTYFSTLLQFETEKSRNGLFMNDVNADAIITQCTSLLSMEESDNFLLTVFNEKIDALPFLTDQEKDAFKKQNRTAVLSHVMYAYSILSDGLKSLKGTGVNENGLCYFPKGKLWYEYLIRSLTGSYLPLSGIEKRIRVKLNEDLISYRELLPTYQNRSVTEAFALLPKDPSAILLNLKNEMKKEFPDTPKVNCKVKYVDEALSAYLSPAFYLTPPIDDLKNHVIYINPSASLDPLSLYTTLAHEGYPGHMYQNLLSAAHLSPIRSLLPFGGYTEGWATYVEMESFRYAARASDKPDAAVFADLNRLNRSFMLGISSLLDICIHYHGFTLQDTRRFLENLGFKNEKAADSLFYSILESPGNYLKYYLGYLTFLDLRAYFEEQYPDTFTLKDFHEKILSIGPCQFPVLEKYLKTAYE